MYLVFIGVAVFFNAAIILMKFNKERYIDALLDAGLLALVMYMFRGSFDALVVGTVASALISIYLLVFRPRFIKEFEL